jgi:hypothetical protein
MRNIHYIDVGKLSHKEAVKVINDCRIEAGLQPFEFPSFNWIPAAVLLLVLSLSLQTFH